MRHINTRNHNKRKDRADFIYSYYKDHWQLSQKLAIDRDRTIVMVGLSLVMLLLVYAQTEDSRLFFSDLLKVNILFTDHVIRISIWLVFLYSLMRYANTIGQLIQTDIWLSQLGREISAILNTNRLAAPTSTEILVAEKKIFKQSGYIQYFIHLLYSFIFPLIISLVLLMFVLDSEMEVNRLLVELFYARGKNLSKPALLEAIIIILVSFITVFICISMIAIYFWRIVPAKFKILFKHLFPSS